VPTQMLDTYAAIDFSVYDWDKTGSNDLITRFKLDMFELAKLAGPVLYSANTVVFEPHIPLKCKKSGASLSLRFQITWPMEFQNWPPPHRQMFIEKKLLQNKVRDTLRKHKINEMFFLDLMSLDRFEIVFIIDDSGSMQSHVDTGGTRWDELKRVMEISVDIACALDDDGTTLIFLNREGGRPIDNVKNWKQVSRYFNSKPSGTTPLSAALEKALNKPRAKPLLVCIATDGAPNDLKKFTNLLKTRDTKSTFISILACSDNDKDVGYLNKLDSAVPHLDVLDDFKSERDELKRVNKEIAKFYSLGDHCARYFLGAVYDKYDKMDGI